MLESRLLRSFSFPGCASKSSYHIHFVSLGWIQQQSTRRVPNYIVTKAWIHSSSNEFYSSITDEISDANQRTAKSVTIRSTNDSRGRGVFALRSFEMGETVLTSKCLSSSSTQGTHTIQIDWNTHIVMDLPSRLLNHHCENANLGVRFNPKKSSKDSVILPDAYEFVAMKVINKDDELLIDYETTEYQATNDNNKKGDHVSNNSLFECECGASACRGALRGFRYNSDMIMKKYGKENIAPYLFTPKETINRFRT